MEVGTGIEPALPAWKAGFLTIRRTHHIGGDDRLRTCKTLLLRQICMPIPSHRHKWLGMQDSNPPQDSQSVLCYLYTNPQYKLCLSRVSECFRLHTTITRYLCGFWWHMSDSNRHWNDFKSFVSCRWTNVPYTLFSLLTTFILYHIYCLLSSNFSSHSTYFQ